MDAIDAHGNWRKRLAHITGVLEALSKDSATCKVGARWSISMSEDLGEYGDWDCG